MGLISTPTNANEDQNAGHIPPRLGLVSRRFNEQDSQTTMTMDAMHNAKGDSEIQKLQDTVGVLEQKLRTLQTTERFSLDECKNLFISMKPLRWVQGDDVIHRRKIVTGCWFDRYRLVYGTNSCFGYLRSNHTVIKSHCLRRTTPCQMHIFTLLFSWSI